MSVPDHEPVRVLHVDDDPAFIDLIETVLEGEGFEVTTARSGSDGLDHLETAAIDCVVSDYDMPSMDGLEFLDAVRATHSDLPFILFTGKGSEEIASEAISTGVTDYLNKHSSGDQYTLLANRISNAVSQYRAEHELQQREREGERYQTAIETVDDAVYALDENGHFEFVDQNFTNLTGYTRGELLESGVELIKDQETIEMFEDQLRKMLSEDISDTIVEFELRTNGGDAVACEDHMGLRWVDGEYQGVVGAIRDITDRKESEAALRAAKERFQSLASNTSLGVVTIDADSTVQFANAAVQDLFGYTPDEMVGESLATIIPPQLEEAHFEAFGRYLRTGEKTLDWEWIELPARHRNGCEIQVGVSFGEHTIDGKRQLTGVIRDITERHESDEYRRRLYELTTNGGTTTDETVERILDLGCEYFDLESGFLTHIEDGTQRIVRACSPHEALRSGSECPLSEAYCRKTIEMDEPMTVANAGASGWEGDPAYDRFGLESYMGAKLMIDGERYGTVCFADRSPRTGDFSTLEMAFFDLLTRGIESVLEQHKYEVELEQQNDRLQEFASVLSHDLRNPLTVANGYLELAQDTGADEYFTKIGDAHNRMDSIIEDMLRLARHGEPIGEATTVELAVVAQEAWKNIATTEATFDHEDDLGEFEADETRLTQLFENLYRNAIDHAGEDVTVRVGTFATGFYVEDDGPGIPVGEREHVFDRGYTTADEGTGLGLAIVDTIAGAHGWTMGVSEGIDGGTRFDVHVSSTPGRNQNPLEIE